MQYDGDIRIVYFALLSTSHATGIGKSFLFSVAVCNVEYYFSENICFEGTRIVTFPSECIRILAASTLGLFSSSLDKLSFFY